MLNIKDIQLFKTSSFGNVILVENNRTSILNPFRDEIFSSRPVPIFRKSTLYIVPTALFGDGKSLSTNILSLAGQVKLTPMRKIGTTCTDFSVSPAVKIYLRNIS